MNHNRQEHLAERVRLNQQELSSLVRTRFDYIVCGAGTSGCVVAARLAADPQTTVLLLEAGGSDEMEVIENPNRWPMTLDTELDWACTTEPNPRLNGRSLRYSMGKVLGGGSSINVSTWSRGHRADWDFCARESGDPSWSYGAVLELYRRSIEAWAGKPDPDYRGQLEVRSFRRVAREGCSVMLSTRVALDVSLFKQISKAAGLPGRGHKACTPGSNSAEQARKLLRVAQGHGDVRSRAA